MVQFNQDLMERYFALGNIVNTPYPEGVVGLAYNGFICEMIRKGKCGRGIGDVARDLKRIVEDAEAFSKTKKLKR